MEKARILIVEDEAIIAMEVESQLQSLGYDVTSIVDTGVKAIKKAEEDKPDIILMDIRIKGKMDGIGAAEAIRSQFGIPVIFSTAYLDEERIEQAKITMPFGYVLKPIQERDLRVTLEMALYVAKVDIKRKLIEGRYMNLVNILDSGVAVYQVINDGTSGSDYIIKSFNRYALEHEEKTLDEIIGKSLKDLRPTIDEFGLIDTFRKVWQTGEPAFFPAKVYVDEKYSHYYENRVFRLPSGEIVAIYDDVTKQKQADEKLQESDAHFRIAFENANIGMCLVEIDGRLKLVNGQMSKMLGFSKEEFEKMTINDITHPEDTDISPKFIQKAASGVVERAQFEKRYIHKLGHIVWGEVSSSLVRDFKGEPSHFISHVQDITKRKLAENESKKFKTITDEASYGSAIVDLEGNIEYVNNEFAKMHQYTPEELIGKQLTIFHTAEQIPEVTKLNKELKKVGSYSSKEVWHKKKDGSVFPTLMNATVINECGNPKYLSATAIDITEYKKLENNSQTV